MGAKKRRQNAGPSRNGGTPNEPDAPLPLGERVIHAVSVLRGRSMAVTPAQLLAWRMEIFELKQQWNSTQEILNAWSARVAQRERRALEALGEDTDSGGDGPGFDKNALRAQVYGG